jgi:hypothetical protein
MHSQAKLKDSLEKVAALALPSADYEVRVLQRAQRTRRRRHLVSTSAAALSIALLVAALRFSSPMWNPQLTASPPDGPFLGWAPTGNSLDSALTQQAVESWDSTQQASPGPHTAARTLLATRDPLIDQVVVLEAYDRNGLPRIAFFTSDKKNGNRLTLRDDRPAPDPSSTQVISIVSSRMTGPYGEANTDYWGTYAIAVAMPGVTRLTVDSTAIDQTLRGGGLDNGRFVVQQLPISGSAVTATVTGFVSFRKVFHVAADHGASGDAIAVRAKIVSRRDQKITVEFSDLAAVRAGQFAVAENGLVGRVETVDLASGSATINLVTSPTFSCPAYTDISNVTGIIRGGGDKLILEGLPTGGESEVNEGNRILTPDPSQGNGRTGAITVGMASQTKQVSADAVELRPSVNISDIQDVSIMIPYDKG